MDPAGINETISLVQSVIKLGKRATNLQYEEALLAAREAILKLREKSIDLKEENYALKEENAKLKAGKELTGKVRFVGGAYWRATDDGEWEGPFCNACWVDQAKLVPLTQMRVGQVRWTCPSCRAGYGYDVLDYIPQENGSPDSVR